MTESNELHDVEIESARDAVEKDTQKSVEDIIRCLDGQFLYSFHLSSFEILMQFPFKVFLLLLILIYQHVRESLKLFCMECIPEFDITFIYIQACQSKRDYLFPKSWQPLELIQK